MWALQENLVLNFENFSRNDFLHDMPMVPWHVLDVFDDVNKIYAFEQLFVDVLDQYTPLKQTHISGNQVLFMTRMVPDN